MAFFRLTFLTRGTINDNDSYRDGGTTPMTAGLLRTFGG